MEGKKGGSQGRKGRGEAANERSMGGFAVGTPLWGGKKGGFCNGGGAAGAKRKRGKAARL